ncbi:hypothetical protein [Aureimonas sp. SA4125]|uniref:hypothetical protein n=1 Tax=Aureimonas sp. SA4125 TaxID=2826993 RepID=UPI001CC7EA02|nr:hypothetical protein [Aureimonas sp. SA4125]
MLERNVSANLRHDIRAARRGVAVPVPVPVPVRRWQQAKQRHGSLLDGTVKALVVLVVGSLNTSMSVTPVIA